jgi:hypothetical protein
MLIAVAAVIIIIAVLVFIWKRTASARMGRGMIRSIDRGKKRRGD